MKIKNIAPSSLFFGAALMFFGAPTLAVNPATSPLQSTDKTRLTVSNDTPFAAADRSNVTSSASCNIAANTTKAEFLKAFSEITNNKDRFECLLEVHTALEVKQPTYNDKAYVIGASTEPQLSINKEILESRNKQQDTYDLQFLFASLEKCFDGDKKWYCWNRFSYSSMGREGFGGIAAGVAGNSNTIVITPLQYDLRFSETYGWHLPLTIYSAEISSSADPEDANQAKLLDPEQGLLNVTMSGIGKFRIGEFCKFDSAFGCYVSLQGAMRYTRFRATEDIDSNKGTDANAIGGLLKLGVNFVFPIYELSQGIAGHLALSGAYTGYYQNLSDSTILFSDALDTEGNPLAFDKSYQAWNVNAELAITDKLGLKLKYFDPIDSDILKKTFAVEFTYDVN